MSPAAVALWIFLALLIGFIALILVATWFQVREEAERASDRDDGAERR